MAHGHMTAAAALLLSTGLLLVDQSVALTSQMRAVESPALTHASPGAQWTFGGAWADVDGDGDLDFALPGDWEKGVHVQWVRNDGDGKLVAGSLDEDVEGGPDGTKLGQRAAVLAADFNNDGLVDLYLTACVNLLGRDHPTNCSHGVFYENLGGGNFRGHQDTGMDSVVVEFAPAAADVDGDGLLDLFVAEGLPRTSNVDIAGVYTNKLYINKGGFKFEDSGVDVDNPGTCCSTFLDIDEDGDQDLVTGSCNLLKSSNVSRGVASTEGLESVPGPIRLHRNLVVETGSLSFEDATDEIFGPLDPGLWMGVAVADVNHDDRVDIYVGQTGDHSEGQQHLLLLSAPGSGYRNASAKSGIDAQKFTWGSAFLDLNNDGHPDLVTVGAAVTSENGKHLQRRNPGTTFLNTGYGRFNREGDLGLSDFMCSGLATADFDEDGSEDVMIIASTPANPILRRLLREKGRLHLFRGRAPGNMHVSLELKGTVSNRQGIGSLVRLCTDSVPRICQKKALAAGSSFASTHSPYLHFGTGSGIRTVNVEVTWPTGQREAFAPLKTGQRHALVEGEGRAVETVETVDEQDIESIENAEVTDNGEEAVEVAPEPPRRPPKRRSHTLSKGRQRKSSADTGVSEASQETEESVLEPQEGVEVSGR
eukprot:evm.model.scf_1378.2 EVM.evm.TU.scf_1378.2   scf_1378:3344-11000(-)